MTPHQTAQIPAFIAEGLTYREVGERLDASTSAVRAWCRRNGLASQAGSGRPRRVDADALARALAMVAEGRSVAQAARATGLSRSAVYYHAVVRGGAP